MPVIHNAAQCRYELATLHGMAVAAYRREGNSVVFTHTEVPAEDGGQGIGSLLVREALDDVQRRGLKIVPACSFVVDFVRRHPEYVNPI